MEAADPAPVSCTARRYVGFGQVPAEPAQTTGPGFAVLPAQRLGRPPQLEEIAAGAGLNPDQVRAALTVPDTVSWHAPVGEDGAILGDFIEGDEPDGPMVDADLDGIANLLREAVARLPAREARIVTLRYGLADGQPRRLADIGAELGLTSERIRQLERRALCKLRHPAFGIFETDFL